MPAPARAPEPLGAALAHQQAGRLAEAEAAYLRLLEAEPGHAVARYNLGLVYRGLGRRDEALACIRRAAELAPAMPELQYALGHVLREEDRLAEAAEAFRLALAARPDYAEARWSLAMCALPRVFGPGEDPRAARAAFEKELDALDAWFAEPRAADVAAAVGVVQPFSLAYQEEPNRELLERYGRLSQRLMAPSAPTVQPARRTDRVRVAVVSSHFRSHSVWNAIVKGWFRHLDEARFELLAFHLGSQEDAETAFARSRAARFVQGARGTREWAAAIAAERPDVILYPELGMDALTYRLACLRLAPVQAAAWGHPETSGVPAVDYYLSADLMEPEGAEANYSERLVRLPHLGCHIEPRKGAVEPPRFEDWGMDPDSPLLLSPGTPFKYAPGFDEVFAEIAKRLGECCIAFFAYGAQGPAERLQARLKAAFAARGVDPARTLRFIPWQTGPQFHGWLSRADVYLDTIGFSGFNTAVFGIERGVPIVTREGRFLRGRLASGPLKRIGLADLVAPDERAYVELAVRLVEDADFSEEVEERTAAGRPALYGDLESVRALEAFLAGQDVRTP